MTIDDSFPVTADDNFSMTADDSLPVTADDSLHMTANESLHIAADDSLPMTAAYEGSLLWSKPTLHKAGQKWTKLWEIQFWDGQTDRAQVQAFSCAFAFYPPKITGKNKCILQGWMGLNF